MQDLKIQFGKRLGEIRTKKKLTQLELAEKIGVSVDFIGLMERGINAPSFNTLSKLSHTLDTPVYELFYFNNKE